MSLKCSLTNLEAVKGLSPSMVTPIYASLLLGRAKGLTLPFLVSGFKLLHLKISWSLLISIIRFYDDFYNTLLLLSYLDLPAYKATYSGKFHSHSRVLSKGNMNGSNIWKQATRESFGGWKSSNAFHKQVFQMQVV